MYILSLFNYQRRQTTSAQVGDIIIGSKNHIVLQSMGNTDTNDTEASALQAKRIYDAGGELVRFTTQGIREAQNIEKISDYLSHTLQCQVPLVADVHFNAAVAVEAAKTAHKVRINPGNFVAPQCKTGNYSAAQEEQEVERIKIKLHEVLSVCKNQHTALRIGVNHGSLSLRMLNKYGDTPQGLAMSCIEFLELCRAETFDNIVLSVKASNVVVMVEAVRMLVEEMQKRDMHYPLHLGVTEAGDGEDGRIKSAVGIGALLIDGIGDTIRVSLSEDPECEIPVAQQIADYVKKIENAPSIVGEVATNFNPFVYHRRLSHELNKMGGTRPVAVVGDKNDATLPADYTYNDIEDNAVRLSYNDLTDSRIEQLKAQPQIIVLYSQHANPVAEMRAAFHKLVQSGIEVPVVIERNYGNLTASDVQIYAAIELGALLLDGFGDAISLHADNLTPTQLNSLSFSILQATRVRMSKIEYISCPSCGRTMFNLQETLKEIKQATSHLKNLKLAVMGCIVNGPGEMADADYGYVGAGKGRVSLYKGKCCIEKNIPQQEAVTHLLALLEKDGVK